MAMRARVFDDWVRHMLFRKFRCHRDPYWLRAGQPGQPQRPSNTMWYDMDFPEVITERKKFYAETAHYHMLSGNAADPMWLTQIPAGKASSDCDGRRWHVPRAQRACRSVREAGRSFSSLCLLMDVYTRLGANLTRFKNPIHEVG